MTLIGLLPRIRELEYEAVHNGYAHEDIWDLIATLPDHEVQRAFAALAVKYAELIKDTPPQQFEELK